MKGKIIISNIGDIVMVLFMTAFSFMCAYFTGMLLLPIIFALLGYSFLKSFTNRVEFFNDNMTDYMLGEYFILVARLGLIAGGKKIANYRAELTKYRDTLNDKDGEVFDKKFVEYRDLIINTFNKAVIASGDEDLIIRIEDVK